MTAIFDAGGAQAIAALAYGTASVPRVDKIVGPGNLYVACAKRLVFGAVDIDGIAGPSEILVLADDEADPRVVAADLLSQAEHDEAAYPLLVCTIEPIADAVAREVEAQLEGSHASPSRGPRRHGRLRARRGHRRSAWREVADAIAAEHLAIHVEDPEDMLASMRHAGAAFIGTR